MEKLNRSWITEGTIDFEYKKYLLLAYLKHIDQQFEEARLFPYFNELLAHFEVCKTISVGKQEIKTAFPKKLMGLNFERLRLDFDNLHEDDPFLCEINSILEFAISEFKIYVNKGLDLIKHIGANITVSPLGILPLRTQEGYLFLQHHAVNLVSVYYYELALYNNCHERYLKTQYIEQVKIGIVNNIAQLKINLIKKYKKLPNPATYIVESKYDYPISETLLPVAEQMLLRHGHVA